MRPVSLCVKSDKVGMVQKRQEREEDLVRCARLFFAAVKHRFSMYELDPSVTSASWIRWSLLHYECTQDHDLWTATRGILMSTEDVYNLCNKGEKTLHSIPIINDMRGVRSICRPETQSRVCTDAMTMGINMETIVREHCVPDLFPSLTARRAGRITSWKIPGVGCTPDIVLLDKRGRFHGLVEVKTLSSSAVVEGLDIPKTEKAAAVYVKTMLANKNKFVPYGKYSFNSRMNIFRQISPLVDIEMFKMYKTKHGDKQLRSFKSLHDYVPTRVLLDSCDRSFRSTAIVAFYEYTDCCTPPEISERFKLDIGLAINPWSSVGLQVLNQTVLYENSVLRRQPGNSKLADDDGCLKCLYVMFVIPYQSDIENPRPYATVLIPVVFGSEVKEKFAYFLQEKVRRYVSSKDESKDDDDDDSTGEKKREAATAATSREISG